MEVGKLGWLPEGIYHAPDQSFNPEYKEWRKEYDKKYHSTPEYKAKRQALAAHTKRYRRNMK